MNGRIAEMTCLPHRLFAGRAATRNLRAMLLVACCVMSLALLGAVRLAPQFRPNQIAQVLPAPAGSNATTPAAEPKELPRATPSLPEDEPLTDDAVVAGSVLRASPTPVLVGPKLRKIMMEVTAYCPCPKCCGPRAQGITASGRRVSYNGGRFVAADTRILKFNTRLLIPGYAGAQAVEVIDKGGAIKGNKLDVYFPTHQEARKWGRQKLLVTVLED